LKCCPENMEKINFYVYDSNAKKGKLSASLFNLLDVYNVCCRYFIINEKEVKISNFSFNDLVKKEFRDEEKYYLYQ
jgi:hypothetical protein